MFFRAAFNLLTAPFANNDPAKRALTKVMYSFLWVTELTTGGTSALLAVPALLAVLTAGAPASAATTMPPADAASSDNSPSICFVFWMRWASLPPPYPLSQDV